MAAIMPKKGGLCRWAKHRVFAPGSGGPGTAGQHPEAPGSCSCREGHLPGGTVEGATHGALAIGHAAADLATTLERSLPTRLCAGNSTSVTI